MNQPLVEGEKFDPAALFEEMAKAIRHNADQPFGGAVVIAPPQGGGRPIYFATLGASDLAQFYATISAMISAAVRQVDEQNRIAQGFHR